jgi:hypothetical protein
MRPRTGTTPRCSSLSGRPIARWRGDDFGLAGKPDLLEIFRGLLGTAVAQLAPSGGQEEDTKGKQREEEQLQHSPLPDDSDLEREGADGEEKSAKDDGRPRSRSPRGGGGASRPLLPVLECGDGRTVPQQKNMAVCSPRGGFVVQYGGVILAAEVTGVEGRVW